MKGLTLAFSIISLARVTSFSWFVDRLAMTYAQPPENLFFIMSLRGGFLVVFSARIPLTAQTTCARQTRTRQKVGFLRRGVNVIDFCPLARYKWQRTLQVSPRLSKEVRSDGGTLSSTACDNNTSDNTRPTKQYYYYYFRVLRVRSIPGSRDIYNSFLPSFVRRSRCRSPCKTDDVLESLWDVIFTRYADCE